MIEEKLGVIIVPEFVDVNKLRIAADYLGVEINLDIHPSEQAELIKNELVVQQSLYNMLLGKETLEEFLDKLEATGAVVMDEYLNDVLDKLEDVGIFNL